MPYGRDINTFVEASEMLLSHEVVAANLSLPEHQVIQFYLAALLAKFPAILK